MKLEILAMGKVKDKHYKALMREYMGRLGHYLTAVETPLRESKLTAHDVAGGLEEEAREFDKRCNTHTIRVAMDERGELLSSIELASKVEDWMTYGTRHVAFMIGSANGLAPEVREQADLVLALTPMTLPHEMARVMLAEQLYRSLTIIRNEPYHK